MAVKERRVQWEGASKKILRGVPDNVKWVFGRALYKAQLGKRHRIASSMKGRLGGIVELAKDANGDTYRLYYTLKCPDHVYVLYCHKKKSKRGVGLPKHDRDLITQRFKDAMIDCEERQESAR